MSEERSPREELADLVASVGALLEWHLATGSVGIERGSGRPAEPVADEPAPIAHATAPEAVYAPEAPRAPAAHPPRAPRAHGDEAPGHDLVARPASPARPAARPDGLAPGDRGPALALLAEEAAACAACALHTGRARSVFGSGSPTAEILFVGSEPSGDDEANGAPFGGEVGKLFDGILRAMAMRREDVYVTNIVACRPPGDRDASRDEVRHCSRFLDQQIAIVQPRAIVALGTKALHALTGTRQSIGEARGTWKLYKGRVRLMPTFSLEYLVRKREDRRTRGLVWEDLQLVLHELGREPAKRQ